jgi:nucleoside-diphosphate-sugar epimerase
MKVLVAGCGDVGSILAVRLLEDGHVVYGLKRDTSTLPEHVRPVQADLTRPETLGNLPQEIDTLVFLPTPASRDQAGYEAIFIDGWRNLWAGLKHAPARTLLVSSTAVFGESGGELVDESTIPAPAGFNGKVLLRMEQQAAACTRNLIIARISGIYGPGRERLIKLAAADGVEVQQTPAYFTNRIHRDDAAAALAHLLYLEKPESLYLVSDDLPAPRYEVVEWLATVQGKPSPAARVDAQGSRGKRVSNRRLRESGFSLAYPDYRAGYSAVLGR